MTGKTHQVIGQTTGLITFLSLSSGSYNPATLAFTLVASSVSALLPDIDQPTSRLWHAIPFGHVAGEAVDPILKHRNVSHSLLGAIILGVLFYWLLSLMPSYWGVNTEIVFWVFTASYLSHLLADMVTVEGIPLLFPYQGMIGIPPKPFQGIRIMTGKWFENLVLFPIVNLALLIVIISNWTKIHSTLFR